MRNKKRISSWAKPILKHSPSSFQPTGTWFPPIYPFPITASLPTWEKAMLTLDKTRHLYSCRAFHAQGQFEELHRIKSWNIWKWTPSLKTDCRGKTNYNASMTSMTFTGSRLLVFTVPISQMLVPVPPLTRRPPSQSVTAAGAKRDNVAATLSVLGGLALAL